MNEKGYLPMSSPTIFIPNQRVEINTEHPTALQGNQLQIFRVIWFWLTLIALVFFVLSLPAYLDQLRTMTDAPPADSFQISMADAQGLMANGISLDVYAGINVALALIRAIPFVAVGLFIFLRRSNDRMTLIASEMMILMGVFASATQPIPNALFALDDRWFFPVTFIYSITGYMILLFFSTFPSGRFVPEWIKWVNILWLAWVMVTAFFPNSPLDIQSWDLLPLLIIETIIFGCGVYSQIYRYRRIASHNQRQQSKWMMYGSGFMIFLGVLIPAFVLALFPEVTKPGFAHAVFGIFTNSLLVIGSFVMLATMTISILRYQLWEIDILINRSLIYGLITLVLSLVFLGSVFILQQIFQMVTGDMFSPAALAISTLIIGGLFQPVQGRLRHLVNRRIYHLIIDPQTIKKKENPAIALSTLASQSLGQYENLEPLGRGGMGEVYLAWQPALNRSVAIKVLARHLATESEFLTRFEREARLVASLQHPHIVQIYDLDYDDDKVFMVMEHIEGDSLSMLLKQQEQLALETILSILTDIAEALDYIHERGLVHRDIKPSNVMIRRNTTPYPQAVLLDFGVARLLSSQTRVTGTGLLGTLDYAAPEQIVAAHDVDHRADIYALGVMTYQLLSGKLPFQSESASQVVFAHLYKPAPDIREIVPEIPAPIAYAILRAMEKAPQDRFDNATAFAMSLMSEQGEPLLQFGY